MFFLLGIALFVLLPSPWSWFALVVCPLLGVVEVGVFWRRVRGRKVEVGAETMIGRRAKVVAACRPLGQVALAGELWAARCAAGAGRDETVEVVGREGLVLVVERTSPK
jgi:membrane protein implicated in regulation of membrane protease activity